MSRSLPHDAVIHMTEDYNGVPMEDIPLEVLQAFNKEYRLEKCPVTKRVFAIEFKLIKEELKRRKIHG